MTRGELIHQTRQLAHQLGRTPTHAELRALGLKRRDVERAVLAAGLPYRGPGRRTPKTDEKVRLPRTEG